MALYVMGQGLYGQIVAKKKKKKVLCFHTTLQNRLFQTPRRCILKSTSQNAAVPWASEEFSDAELGLG